MLLSGHQTENPTNRMSACLLRGMWWREFEAFENSYENAILGRKVVKNPFLKNQFQTVNQKYFAMRHAKLN